MPLSRNMPRRHCRTVVSGSCGEPSRRHAFETDGERYGPERSVQTGIGALEVRRPKGRDRAGVPAERKIRFSSAILPRWARRSKSLDALLPVL